MALLISKSLLHSERNRLLAPREANQIKQSGKEDSLFINLTRSPGDSHSRLGILLQLLLDASPMLLALLAWITQAGTWQHPTPWVESGRGATDSGVTLLFSDASTSASKTGTASPLPSPRPCPLQTAEFLPSLLHQRSRVQYTALLRTEPSQCQQALLA